MLITRLPRPSLRPFVKMLWATEHTNGQRCVPGAREHVLPTGSMHFVFRLSDPPLRLFAGVEDTCGHTLGHAVVGGARSTFYVRDISTPSCSVGAQLYPGVAEILFGATADELSERHTRLEDLWGRAALVAHEQLLAAGGPERQLAVFEALLAARLPVVRGLHPVVAHALERFVTPDSIREVVKDSGHSHRHFIALFRRAVGLPPKLYCRVMRFQRALERVTADGTASWVDLAIEAGYSDQPHFNREFQEFAGIAPGEYRKIVPAHPHHVGVSGPTR
jgi:AraC-like DNA-binding protein